ncbi:MAG: MraY family glycosyltransferase [Burkholderiaceae bacterium]
MPLAHVIHWVDRPTTRKQHEGEIPLVGGAAFASSLLMVLALNGSWPIHAQGLITAIPLMLMVGAFDDVRPVRARYRFAAQLTAAFAITFIGGTVVHQLGQCFAPFNVGLSLLAVPFTMVCITGLINAYNMSDGLDGLCGGHALIALVWFTAAALFFAGADSSAFAELAPIVLPSIGALLGFLALNARAPWRARAAIFLGDGGSMVLGLIVAWVAITVSQPYQASALSPAAAVWIVAVPVADMFTCMIRRIGEGKTPMTADRHHLHHMLLEMGVPARRAVYLLWLLSLLCGAVGVGGTWLGLPEYLMLWALVLLFAMYTRFSIKFWRKHQAAQAAPLPSDLSDPGPVTRRATDIAA